MNKKTLWQFCFSFLCAVIMLPTITKAQKNGKIKTVDAVKFQHKVEHTQNVQLIDVRTPHQFSEGHLQGAANYDVMDSTLQRNLDKLNKKKKVFVYCGSGVRSMKAAEILKSKGFKVINLDGGMAAWKEKQLPVVHQQ